MRYLCLFLLFLSCNSNNKTSEVAQEVQPHDIQEIEKSTEAEEKPPVKNFPAPDYDSEMWTELKDDSLFILDIRYATANNFMKQKIYDCGKCFLRPIVAEKFIAAAKEFYAQGYKTILFDCYRPQPYQQKLWDIMPNAMYVTPPNKGSMHNRGHAIDIGLYNRSSGQIVDFGTEYDYFGKEAHYAYPALTDSIKNNRIFLRKTLEKNGFTGIRTEWWHFSYKKDLLPFSDWLWNCNY